jgi:membrane associated rhomboid family serine protease
MILPGRIFYKKYFWPSLNISSLLVAICFLVYAFVNWSNPESDTTVLEKIEVGDYWKLESMYLQTLDPILKAETANNGMHFDLTNAFKDQNFWARSRVYVFQGNQSEIIELKKLLVEAGDQYRNSTAFQYGLGHEATTPLAWITYQFVHTQFLHLFLNMVFLFLIVAQLERRVRTEWIISVYLLSGFGAGVLFLISSQDNTLAMIGASGSISGLLAFASVVLYNTRIKWSYFITPLKGGFGTIYLPAFLIFFVFLVADFSRLLSSKDGVQSAVAHSAHVGGALVGLALGFFYLFDRWFKNYLIEKWGPALGPNELRKLRDE